MLMRALEEPIFDRTRAWLAERQDHVFTLVVDELHLYRGTKGSEVALVVRNLLSRLGIEPDSAQLRCMATSASLAGDNSGQVFLEQFFGVDRSSFVVLPGRTKELGGSLPLRRADLIQAATAAPTEDLADLAVNAQLASAVALACHDPKTGRYRATPLATVAAGQLSRCAPTCSPARSGVSGPARTATATRSPHSNARTGASAGSTASRQRHAPAAAGCSSCSTATSAATSAWAGLSSAPHRRTGTCSARARPIPSPRACSRSSDGCTDSTPGTGQATRLAPSHGPTACRAARR